MFNSRRGPIVLFILPVVHGGDEEAEMKVEVVVFYWFLPFYFLAHLALLEIQLHPVLVKFL